jgi:hypothetical protein
MISGPFSIGNLVGVGCRMTGFGPRLGTLLGTFRAMKCVPVGTYRPTFVRSEVLRVGRPAPERIRRAIRSLVSTKPSLTVFRPSSPEVNSSLSVVSKPVIGSYTASAVGDKLVLLWPEPVRVRNTTGHQSGVRCSRGRFLSGEVRCLDALETSKGGSHETRIYVGSPYGSLRSSLDPRDQLRSSCSAGLRP